MAVLATRVYIDNIAKQMGCKTGEYCGSFYIIRGDYRIYVVNAREFSNRGYDRSFVKEHWFDWVIKKPGKEENSWEEIFRTSVKYLTNDLYTVIPQDLQKLDRYIQSDMEMTKSKYHSGLTQIAKQYGLDISSKVVRDALVAAYKLGQKENSTRN